MRRYILPVLAFALAPMMAQATLYRCPLVELPRGILNNGLSAIEIHESPAAPLPGQESALPVVVDPIEGSAPMRWKLTPGKTHEMKCIQGRMSPLRKLGKNLKTCVEAWEENTRVGVDCE